MSEAEGQAKVTAEEQRLSRRGIVWKVLGGILFAVMAISLFLPAVRTAREPARRYACFSNLRQISLALQNYHGAHGVFPPAATTDSAGKPLHSWRALILPYLEEQALYHSIDFTKPWGDPANDKARQATVSIYQCPSVELPPERTTYLAVVTPKSCFRPGQGRGRAEIIDGDDHTLIVVEVDPLHAVHWMAPQDADETLVLGVNDDVQLPHNGGTHGVFADGSVRYLSGEIDPEAKRAMISIADGDRDSLDAE